MQELIANVAWPSRFAPTGLLQELRVFGVESALVRDTQASHSHRRIAVRLRAQEPLTLFKAIALIERIKGAAVTSLAGLSPRRSELPSA